MRLAGSSICCSARRLVGRESERQCPLLRRRLCTPDRHPSGDNFVTTTAGPCCDNSSPERAEVWTRPIGSCLSCLLWWDARLPVVAFANHARASLTLSPQRRQIGGRAAKRSCGPEIGRRRESHERTRPHGCDHPRHWPIVRVAGVGKAVDLPQLARVATARQSCCGWRSARDRRKRTD